MKLKIFLTGDLHIGMKFNSYSGEIKEELKEARFNALDNLIREANKEKANIFAIPGDLFDSIKVSKKEVDKVVDSLSKFTGEVVLIMPGNHDYDDGLVEIWRKLEGLHSEKILVLNQFRPYNLKDYSLDVIVYPAFCHSLHSKENNLGWIKALEKIEGDNLNIGMAHGALIGLSPDMAGEYFPMREEELLDIPMDLWLLGHTHISYPLKDNVVKEKIYNSGTPEPDGLDCKHKGLSWIIDIDEEKNISSRRIITGTYRFYDVEREVFDEEGFKKISKEFFEDSPEKTLLRLNIRGRISKDLFKEKEKYYEEFRKKLLYFKLDDSSLGIKISSEDIEKEFTKGSFPYKFLSSLNGDEESLQLAYELIQEVK